MMLTYMGAVLTISACQIQANPLFLQHFTGPGCQGPFVHSYQPYWTSPYFPAVTRHFLVPNAHPCGYLVRMCNNNTYFSPTIESQLPCTEPTTASCPSPVDSPSQSPEDACQTRNPAEGAQPTPTCENVKEHVEETSPCNTPTENTEVSTCQNTDSQDEVAIIECIENQQADGQAVSDAASVTPAQETENTDALESQTSAPTTQAPEDESPNLI